MGTIFVAYGEAGQRTSVLEFAVNQAANEHGLVVYHIHESEDESVEQIRNEIERIVESTDPSVPYTVQIHTPDNASDLTNTSRQKRLLDAIFESDTEYEYVVMGDVERDTIEGITHASMTKAVLEQHSIPVMLVPVR